MIMIDPSLIVLKRQQKRRNSDSGHVLPQPPLLPIFEQNVYHDGESDCLNIQNLPKRRYRSGKTISFYRCNSVFLHNYACATNNIIKNLLVYIIRNESESLLKLKKLK